MLLFKNSATTMEGVLKHEKHATDGKPHHVKPGDIILIAQTKNTLLPGQKPIRWIMNFVSCEEDVDNLSNIIWGKHWRYIINGNNVRSVEPFDINDIKVTSKNYDAVQTYSIVEPEDEEEVLNWISESAGTYVSNTDVFSNEFKEGKTLDYDELIKKLDEKYKNTPEFKEVITD
jgi:5-methylcytosine-specific restriction enzyme A